MGDNRRVPEGYRVMRTRRGQASKRQMGRSIVIDIETWGLDARESAFALGVAYDGQTYHRFSYAKEMREWILQSAHRGVTFWGHNAGSFDYYVLFDNLFTFFGPDNIIVKGSRLITAKYPIRDRETKGKKIGR